MLSVGSALVATLAVTGGCGGGQSAEERASADVVTLQSALARQDLREVCRRLSRRAQTQIGTVGHKQPTTCPADLRLFLDGLRQTAPLDAVGSDIARAPRPRVARVAIRDGGDTATATLALDGVEFDVPLVNQDDVWKLDDFFGALGPPAPGLR
jgi:hypothetical protein